MRVSSDVDIEVQGNGYYDGIAVALGTNAALDLNFDKGATIKAHQNSAADDLFAVNLAAGSDLKVKGDIDLISTAVGGGTGNNYGIYSALRKNSTGITAFSIIGINHQILKISVITT